MKAISLIQPWASLIAANEKRVETRSWRTHYRGPLAIHASAGKPKYAREFCDDPRVAELLEAHGLTFDTMPRGAVVATTTLADVITVTPTRKMLVGRGSLRDFREADYLLGDLSLGRVAFVLQDIVALPEPIPAKGALGIWEWVQE